MRIHKKPFIFQFTGIALLFTSLQCSNDLRAEDAAESLRHMKNPPEQGAIDQGGGKGSATQVFDFVEGETRERIDPMTDPILELAIENYFKPRLERMRNLVPDFYQLYIKAFDENDEQFKDWYFESLPLKVVNDERLMTAIIDPESRKQIGTQDRRRIFLYKPWIEENMKLVNARENEGAEAVAQLIAHEGFVKLSMATDKYPEYSEDKVSREDARELNRLFFLRKSPSQDAVTKALLRRGFRKLSSGAPDSVAETKILKKIEVCASIFREKGEKINSLTIQAATIEKEQAEKMKRDIENARQEAISRLEPGNYSGECKKDKCHEEVQKEIWRLLGEAQSPTRPNKLLQDEANKLVSYLYNLKTCPFDRVNERIGWGQHLITGYTGYAAMMEILESDVANAKKPGSEFRRKLLEQ
jgi:hypothetical protein